jgi:hypothetical protein
MVGVGHQLVWMASGKVLPAAQRAEINVGLLETAVVASQKLEMANNVKQLAMGALNYHDTFNGLPPGGTTTPDGRLLHGWAIHLGPFAGFDYDGIDFTKPWNEPPNARIYQCNLPMFVNPALPGPHFDSQGYGLSHVAGNIHVLPIETERPTSTDDLVDGGIEPPLETPPRRGAMNLSAMKDGTSNTILLGTVGAKFRPWGHPANVRDPAVGINRSPDGFGGPAHWHGAQFAMCDGSVRTMASSTDPRVLKQLATPAGDRGK